LSIFASQAHVLANAAPLVLDEFHPNSEAIGILRQCGVHPDYKKKCEVAAAGCPLEIRTTDEDGMRHPTFESRGSNNNVAVRF
jgi:hypothetical protein